MSNEKPSRPPRQMILRLDADLADRLDELTATTGASRNSLIAAAVQHAVGLPSLRWTAGAADLRTREGREAKRRRAGGKDQ
jgi:predicted transcriptional regulator